MLPVWQEYYTEGYSVDKYWKGKHVLVTGASGFVGSHMVRTLLENGASVTAAIHGASHHFAVNNHLRIKQAELVDFSSCLDVMKGADMVLHFAAYDGGKAFKMQHGASMFRVNTVSVMNILEAARVQRVGRIMLMSSSDIYPSTTRGILTEAGGVRVNLFSDEDGYTWSKRFLEVGAKLYREEYGMKVTVVRPGNIYGPYDRVDRGRVIPQFIHRALKNEEITVIGNGKQQKSFLFIDDFIAALLSLIEDNHDVNVINVAGNRYISIRELAELVIEKTKSSSKIVISNESELKVRTDKVSLKRFKNLSKFKEKTKLTDGLDKTIQYFMSVAKP